jgi:hypothetical protein
LRGGYRGGPTHTQGTDLGCFSTTDKIFFVINIVPARGGVTDIDFDCEVTGAIDGMMTRALSRPASEMAAARTPRQWYSASRAILTSASKRSPIATMPMRRTIAGSNVPLVR